ncbi:hypothetical protein PGTUg99_036237 [Puccinia graminis f. sp. tritici]|uniref:Uncharacterized protein n=1 Tax=Puccinia graminis f. sp. tritici TaxID=56615 RepID=A0A5B0SGK5_PUCGR|nr:hypothetical protein PGTUg99_036237 [Puccinia graminis f. sp. tritici]
MPRRLASFLFFALGWAYKRPPSAHLSPHHLSLSPTEQFSFTLPLEPDQALS